MSKRPNLKPNIFQRVTQAVSKGVRSLFNIEEKQQSDLNTPKNKSIIKKMVQRIRPAKTSKVSGTTRRIPTAKYSDFEMGWGKGKSKNITEINKTLKDNKQKLELPSGRIMSESEMNKLERVVNETQDKLKKQRDNIVANAYEVYGDVEGMNVELQLKYALEREKRRFTNTTFEDLKDLNIDDVFRELDKGTTIDDYLNNILQQDITPEGHAMRYRDNWADALINTYGDTSQTRELIDRVYNELTLDTFLNTLYNPASTLNIDYIYSEEKMGENLVKMNEEVNKLFEHQDKLKPII